MALPLRWSLVAVALSALVGGCRPDLPDRSCKSNDDCFSQEECQLSTGTCVTRAAETETADASPDAAESDAAP